MNRTGVPSNSHILTITNLIDLRFFEKAAQKPSVHTRPKYFEDTSIANGHGPHVGRRF